MGEFYTQVVRLGSVFPLPNSDKLEITDVLNGYPCIIGKGEYKEGDLVSYISVDAMVPLNNQAFNFLQSSTSSKEYHRIKARRLRGTFSMGLIVPCPPGYKEGDDVTDYYGIKKYEPPSEREYSGKGHQLARNSRFSETVAFDRTVYVVSALVSVLGLVWMPLLPFLCAFAPAVVTAAYIAIQFNRYRNKKPHYQYYDIDGYRRYQHILKDNELVYVTSKIHGMQASYLHTGRKFFCRSRKIFRSEDHWVDIAKRYNLEAIMSKYPGMVLFGEIYGKGIQDLEYGLKTVEFRAFDLMNMYTRQFINPPEFYSWCHENGVPHVEVLYRGPWGKELTSLAEGKSVEGGDHVREGIVIRPEVERRDPTMGRVILKLCGEGYYIRKGASNEV